MEKNIIKQLNLIKRANEWVKSSLEGEKQKNAHHNLVNYRRLLKKKKFALEGNPAAAIYGASQMGKSYLVSSLLSTTKNPFSIIDGEKNHFDFINKINPIGKKTEATSIGTRFSTKYEWKNAKFPVQAKLLSPADLILVICDSYFNDIKPNMNLSLKVEEINNKISETYDKYSQGLKRQIIIAEDDVLDIKDYFVKKFSTKATRIIDSDFFDKIPSFIEHVNSDAWSEIFSLLWNNNEKLTGLFNELISYYEKLGFSKELYIPVEAVLRDYGTLLDVARLHEIYGDYKGTETKYKKETSVLIYENDREKVIEDFSKSFLCALTAELVFRLPGELEEDKKFLKETDLLDFPGARNRLGIHEEEMSNDIIPKMLIRGKVAYLFNKYSDSEKINILLFCQNNEKSELQNILPELVNTWICDMVGDTPVKRDDFMAKSKVSPFFLVSTMFNIDLQYDYNNDTETNDDFRSSRWKRRFLTVFGEVFGSHSWLIHWTISKSQFQNIYLLRDFSYSSDTESKIFKGYNENKTEIQEIVPPNYPNFRKDLRSSFIEYDFVKTHFEDPAMSWDRSASINEDGSQLIIDNLSIAANNINYARREKILEELNEISMMVVAELYKYFHSNDKDEELQKAKKIAGEIRFKLDSAFSADGIKRYGKVMKELMLDERSVFELFRKQIDNIEQRDNVNLGPKIIYLIQVPVIEGDTPDSYFVRLAAHYEKNSEEDKAQFRSDLEKQGVDLYELIHRNADLIKNNSQQLAEALIDYWIAYISLSENQTIQEILASDGSSALQEITEMLQKLAKKVGLAKVIAEKIRQYVDGQTKADIPYGIASDISAELVNKFVNTVGFEYFDDSEINDLKQANEKNSLGLTFDQQNGMGATSVEEVFNRIENWTDIIQSKPEEMKTLPSYRNYLLWYNRLKIGFVSVCDIPNYDVAANETLGTIIKEIETAKY